MYYEPQRTPSQPGVYLRPNYHSGSNPLPPFNLTPQEAVLHHPGQLQNANVERLRLLQALNLDWPREIYCGADVNSVTQCEVRRQLEELFMRQRGDRRYNRSNFTPIWSELSLVPFLCHMDSLPGQISTGIDVIHVIPPLTMPMKNYRVAVFSSLDLSVNQIWRASAEEIGFGT